jgi:hypothetical protein
MIETFLCGYNLFCHLSNITNQVSRPKYPPDVALLCTYFEEQKSELPEYCKWGDVPKPPRRRSEF